MQRRLDDFYISCKRRRVENQHSMLNDMERSLNKTRERVVNRCTKHIDSSGHSSKTRLRRLACPQQVKLPNDIGSVMGEVLDELQVFLNEASDRKSKPRPASPVKTKANEGLETALTNFFIDVSSGKACNAKSKPNNVIRDEFSTSTDEVQDAYYSCQYPILDFPPDLLPQSNGGGDGANSPTSDEDDEDKEGDGHGGRGDNGDDKDQSSPPSPSPSSSAGDDLLSDMEVIEEIDNLMESNEDPTVNNETASDNTVSGDDTKNVQSETDEIEQLRGGPAEDFQATKEAVVPEEIFIDLSKEDASSDVEILFETHMADEEEEEEEDECEESKEVKDNVTTSQQPRNIFEVLSQTNVRRERRKKTARVAPIRTVEDKQSLETVPSNQTKERKLSTNEEYQTVAEGEKEKPTLPDHQKCTFAEEQQRTLTPSADHKKSTSPDRHQKAISAKEPQRPNLEEQQKPTVPEEQQRPTVPEERQKPASPEDQKPTTPEEQQKATAAVDKEEKSVRSPSDDKPAMPEEGHESNQKATVEPHHEKKVKEHSNETMGTEVLNKNSSPVTQLIERQTEPMDVQMEEETKQTSKPKAIRRENDADEVAAAVSAILPKESPQIPPLVLKGASFSTAHVAPAAPTPASVASSCPVERTQESLKQQLINVLDKMVELYESGEGGKTRGPPTGMRLDAMLKESFNIVVNNRSLTGMAGEVSTSPTSNGGVVFTPSSLAVGWNIDKTCADFQSHVSAALSTFLMSPASESGPPSCLGPDRLSDLVAMTDATPILNDDFSIQLDGLDTAAEKEMQQQSLRRESSEITQDSEKEEMCVQKMAESQAADRNNIEMEDVEEDEDDGDLNTSVVTDPDLVCQSVDQVETSINPASTLGDSSPFSINNDQQPSATVTNGGLLVNGCDSTFDSSRCQSKELSKPSLPQANCNPMTVFSPVTFSSGNNYSVVDSDENLNPKKATEKMIEPDDEFLEELFGSINAENHLNASSTAVAQTSDPNIWTNHFVYLFRSDENPTAKEAENVLLRSGARLFDPFHPHLVPASSRLTVLIHSRDAGRIHHIPNLLQLKNFRRIQFLTYEDSYACSLGRGTNLFPAASSCIVIDGATIVSTHPDNLDSLISFIREECLMNRPCRIVLHAQFQKYLNDMRLQCQDRYQMYCIDRVNDILACSRQEGLVHWTGEAESTVRPDNLCLMLKVQCELQRSCRDFFLLTDLDPHDLRAHIFSRSGIAVMSLHQFILNYTTKPFNEYALKRPSYVPDFRSESCPDILTDDAPLSWCIEVLPAYSNTVA